MEETDWHYPRPELAQSTLDLISKRATNALVLFAPRRTGKTEFLLKDLAPLAEKRGHRVIYVNFWQAPVSPLAVLLNACEAALKRGSLLERLKAIASGIKPKLKLSGPLPGSSLETEIDLSGLKGKPGADHLLYLDDLIGRLAGRRKPTIILFDEVQELAREPDNAGLVAALRTSLDKRRDGLAAVFTGSSRQGLQEMFSTRDAPFFHFATEIGLPELDARFVEHMLAAFKAASKRSLNRKAAMAAFSELHASPYFFRRFIETMLLDPSLEITVSLRQFRARIAETLGYPSTWLRLSALQRAVVLALAQGAEKPFAEKTRRTIGVSADLATPTAARVQTALRALDRNGFVSTWQGRWQLDDPEFAAWVREHGVDAM